MSFDALLARDVDRHYGAGDVILRYHVCRNGAYRDRDQNRFVAAEDADETEHSESCDCEICENTRLFGDRDNEY